MNEPGPPRMFDFRRPVFPWLGVLLLVVGGSLLVHEAVPRLDGGALAALIVGSGLWVAWVTGRSGLALWAAVVLLGYGVARLLVGLDVVEGRGWTTLGVGVGLATGWLVARIRSSGSDWVLALAALFALVGAAQLAEHVEPLRGLDRVAAPLVIVGVGVLVIVASFRGRPGGSRW